MQNKLLRLVPTRFTAIIVVLLARTRAQQESNVSQISVARQTLTATALTPPPPSHPAGNEQEEGKVAVKKIHGEGTNGKGSKSAFFWFVCLGKL